MRSSVGPMPARNSRRSLRHASPGTLLPTPGSTPPALRRRRPAASARTRPYRRGAPPSQHAPSRASDVRECKPAGHHRRQAQQAQAVGGDPGRQTRGDLRQQAFFSRCQQASVFADVVHGSLHWGCETAGQKAHRLQIFGCRMLAGRKMSAGGSRWLPPPNAPTPPVNARLRKAALTGNTAVNTAKRKVRVRSFAASAATRHVDDHRISRDVWTHRNATSN